MQQQKPTSFRRLVSATVLVAIIVASITGILYRQEILDYGALRNYAPPAEVVGLANETTMSDRTRRVFYVNHPAINDKTSFKNNCPTRAEQTIVLGCFVENKGIYLLKVDDQRLSGVMQVTAAHEVLHAEYDRLSSDERRQVDAQISSFFATLQNDRIKKVVESYRKNDPSSVPNELHSILGTEVKELSPELEAYYSRYFSNRKQVALFSERYEQTFVGLNEQVTAYDQQLKSLKETITNNELAIDAIGKEIEQQKSRLDTLLNNGSTESYNAAVPGFNAKVREYNVLINQTKQQVADYNEIVEKRNAIVTTEQELVQAISSDISTKQTE